MTATHLIGIDVGGTKIAAGVLAWPEGRAVTRRTLPTLPGRGGRAVLDDVVRLARDLAGDTAPAAVGLGICELVTRDGRLTSGHCIQWLDLPVTEELAAIAPTWIEADVRAAAVAEARFGAGRAFRQFLYITIGTGISGCLMLDGRPHLGTTGATGTMASSPLRIPCENCGHINERTLEEIAAGPALVARFRASHGQATNGQDVLAAARHGHSIASGVVRTAAEALASQVALLVGMLDPQAVIVGGGLGLSDGLFWDSFVPATRRDIWSGEHRDLPILRAATGTDAVWIGAAAHAADKLFSRPPTAPAASSPHP